MIGSRGERGAYVGVVQGPRPKALKARARRRAKRKPVFFAAAKEVLHTSPSPSPVDAGCYIPAPYEPSPPSQPAASPPLWRMTFHSDDEVLGFLNQSPSQATHPLTDEGFMSLLDPEDEPNEVYFNLNVSEGYLDRARRKDRSVEPTNDDDNTPKMGSLGELERAEVNKNGGPLRLEWVNGNPHAIFTTNAEFPFYPRRVRALIGKLTQSECPASYQTFVDVPVSYYKLFWTEFQRIYNWDRSSPELKEYIFFQAAEAYKERKANMKRYYNLYIGDILKRNGIPWLFKWKKEQWKWLVHHFDSKKAIGNCMSKIRKSKRKYNHRTGSKSFKTVWTENFLLKGNTLVSKRLETWLEKHVTFLNTSRRYVKTARAVEEWKQMHLLENPNAPVPAMTDADEAETQRKINEELWESSDADEHSGQDEHESEEREARRKLPQGSRIAGFGKRDPQPLVEKQRARSCDSERLQQIEAQLAAQIEESNRREARLAAILEESIRRESQLEEANRRAEQCSNICKQMFEQFKVANPNFTFDSQNMQL